MIAIIQTNKQEFKVDLSSPLDISIPLRASDQNPTAWYVNPPKISPVCTDQFTGSVAKGGSVNFNNILFNPHGHGTHTECVGHIAKEIYSVNENLNRFFFLAELVSIYPEKLSNGDLIITKKQLEPLIRKEESKAIIIRTLPNSAEKLRKQYSNTNPPYIEAGALKYLASKGIDHLLVDLPSVDRESDDGKLEAHHAFWQYPEKKLLHKTITELIYVADHIKDGSYLLNLQIAPFENDASPSKPILYKII